MLGDHVQQAGSLVEPDFLRFDFTHFSAITPEELIELEEVINNAILEGYPVETREMPIEEAKKMGGHGPVLREVRRHGPGGQHGRLLGGADAAGTHLTTPQRLAPSTF